MLGHRLCKIVNKLAACRLATVAGREVVHFVKSHGR